MVSEQTLQTLILVKKNCTVAPNPSRRSKLLCAPPLPTIFLLVAASDLGCRHRLCRPLCSPLSSSPGYSRKLKKVLETRTDSPYLLDSLATLSTFYADNTPPACRNLKFSIEQRALAINRPPSSSSSLKQASSLFWRKSLLCINIKCIISNEEKQNKANYHNQTMTPGFNLFAASSFIIFPAFSEKVN